MDNSGLDIDILLLLFFFILFLLLVLTKSLDKLLRFGRVNEVSTILIVAALSSVEVW